MNTSFVIGRTGSINDETGLFVLEGPREAFMLSSKTVSAVGGSRDKCEVNSGVPFKEDKSAAVRPAWINQLPTYSKSAEVFAIDVKDVLEDARASLGRPGGIELKDMDNAQEGIYTQLRMKKLRERRYVTEWAGLSPESRALKVIGKQHGMATKRIILFATGVPQRLGGRTWLVTNNGFTWWNGQSKVVLRGGDDNDLEQSVSGTDFLFFAVTNAVPFISGHRKLQRDEDNPRILRYMVGDKQYDDEVEQAVASMVNGTATIVDVASTIRTLHRHGKAGKAGGAVDTPTNSFGIDESIINLQDEDIMW